VLVLTRHSGEGMDRPGRRGGDRPGCRGRAAGRAVAAARSLTGSSQRADGRGRSGSSVGPGAPRGRGGAGRRRRSADTAPSAVTLARRRTQCRVALTSPVSPTPPPGGSGGASGSPGVRPGPALPQPASRALPSTLTPCHRPPPRRRQPQRLGRRARAGPAGLGPPSRHCWQRRRRGCAGPGRLYPRPKAGVQAAVVRRGGRSRRPADGHHPAQASGVTDGVDNPTWACSSRGTLSRAPGPRSERQHQRPDPARLAANATGTITSSRLAWTEPSAGPPAARPHGAPGTGRRHGVVVDHADPA
jgi:hypothetical protein